MLLCDTIILLHTESFESSLGSLIVEAPTTIEAIRDGSHADNSTSPAPSGTDHNRVYDLSGRQLSTVNGKLSTLPKGLYVQKGRKFIGTSPAQQ